MIKIIKADCCDLGESNKVKYTESKLKNVTKFIKPKRAIDFLLNNLLPF